MAGLQTFPLILGWDVSGVVEQVGFGVTTLQPGDEVYGMPWFRAPAPTPSTSPRRPASGPASLPPWTTCTRPPYRWRR